MNAPLTDRDVLERIYDRWNRNEGDLAFDLMDPEIEVRQTPVVFDTGGTFHGHAGLLESARELVTAFERIDWIPQRWVEAGTWVLVDVKITSLGAHSGLTTEIVVTHAWRLQDGLVTDFHVYMTETQAREAIGLD
jgi:ketosteroid isomerase-like protein